MKRLEEKMIKERNEMILESKQKLEEEFNKKIENLHSEQKLKEKEFEKMVKL